MKKVVKFGGSSLASARQFKKVGEIIWSDKSRRYVVPSAPGKRNDKDEKVTAIRFLNDAGAFLITKSGDKISRYFGISKFTLYNYIDVNSRKADGGT